MFSDLPYFKILILDDDEDDFFITDRYIKNIKGYNFQTEWRYDYKTALAELSEKKYDLYLVDYYLGAKTGLDFIREAHERKCEEPIIILTGKGTPELDAEAMHAGAVDYLIKGEMDTEKMERCIRHVIEKSKSVRTLRSNERKFRHIFERSKDAVFLLVPEDFVFNEMNNATSEIFGYSHEELKKMSFMSLLPEMSDRQWIQHQMKHGEIEDKEITLRNHAGELLECILSLSREKDNHGRSFYQGIIHDITELKKAEKNNMRLEKLGMAERLVRTLAHEVRNPLNNINLSLEQLHEEVTSEDGKMFLDIITRNSKRIETLIKELLGASRPEIVLKPRDLKEILNETIAAAQDRITLRHIKFTADIPDEKMLILADTEQLKIAFLNIIINAVEAMEDYGSLTMRLSKKDSDYLLEISDTGCGISEENLARLFEPYFTAKKNGLGLGLAATMNILQQHKAAVEVSSEQGKGTTFTILLPFAEKAVENE